MSLQDNNKPGGLPALPFVFCIGVEKCGTSSLYQCMADSRQFNLPRIKETFFFSRHFDKGLDYYESLFPDPFDGPLMCCDITPSYFRNPDALARIQDFQPHRDKKIIISLRNPLERAFSFYLHNIHSHISKGERTRKFARKKSFSFFDLWERRDDYFFTDYSPLVQNAFDRFGAENCHILLFEDLTVDWSREAAKLDDFLGFTTPVLADTSWPHKNRTEALPYFFKWEAQEAPSTLFNLYCNRRGEMEILTDLTADQVHNAMAIQDSYTLEIPQLFNSQVMQALQADIDTLSELLNRDLAFWKTTRAFKAQFAPSL